MSKKLVDVEDLISWAAAELARKRGGKTALRAAFDLSAANRELVGRWDRPASFPSVAPMFAGASGGQGGGRGDPPHPDALTVETALERLARSPPLCDLDALQLGAGLGFALELAGPLNAALANVSNILLIQGRLSGRPFLRLRPPQAAPRLAANGKPGVWRLETWLEPTFADHAQAVRQVEAPCVARRKNLYPDGAYGVVEWSPDPQDIVADRAEYAAWPAGLEWLAAELHDALESRVALAPRAAWRPWLGERDGDRVPDLYAPGADGVHAADEAARMAAEHRVGRRRPIAGGGAYGLAAARPSKGAREG